MDGAGYGEIVEDGFNGYLYKAGDPSDLANKVATALNRTGVGKNARRTIKSRFNIAIGAARYLEVYRELTE